MHKHIFSICAALCCMLFFVGKCMETALAQNASTQGKDFWFAFMNNNGSDPEQTCLILSAERACSATVTNPNTGWTTTVNIPAGGRVDVDIPLAQGYHQSTVEATPYNLGCHLVATDTISAYSMNYRNASFDGGHLLPTSTLADDYMIETIPPGLNGSSILIVATENGTIVNITPSVATSNGWAANSNQTITLNAGQVFQFTTAMSTGTGSTFSGTRVQTQDCKKIAVFAGGKCAQAPAGCTYCDHIYEPMIPTIYWGNHFIPTASMTRTKDVVRVTALNAGTTVTKNGTVVATLNAGGTYDFEMNSGENSCYIATSGPAVCYLYVTGQSCGGGSGDPSMVYITPIEQNIKRITFGTYERNTTNHYVNVVTRTDNVNSVRLDGTNIGAQFSPVAGNNQYSFARLSINHATHTLSSDSGLVAHVYGLYDVTSYAYSVGSSAIDLTNSMFVNNVNTAEIPENQLYCPNRPIDFEVQLNYGYTDITWDFGDSTTGSGNPCTHIFPDAGSYTVTAIVHRETQNNCFASLYDTIRTQITLPPPDPIPVYVNICDGGSYTFNGRVLTESGVYLDTIVTGSECDSIVELHLSIIPTDPIPVYVGICDGGSYDFLGRELTEPGVYLDTVHTSGGCDSIIELHLSFVPADPIPVYHTICPGETFWIWGESYAQPGVYTNHFTTAGGCDSIVELHLSYAQAPTVNLGSDKVLCTRDEFPIHLSPSVSNATGALYFWSTGETSSGINATTDGTFSVTVTNNEGCVGADDVDIRIQDELTLEIEQVGDYCEGGTATLVAHTNAPNLRWSTGANTTEIEAHGYGRYSVRAYDGACEVTADIEIPKCPFNLYFPNCISASFDDGVNDFFFMSDPSLVTEFEIWIYDRWGMLVYHSNDPHFRWNGTVNGKVAANNEFTWRAFAKPKTEDKKYEFHGSLLVL